MKYLMKNESKSRVLLAVIVFLFCWTTASAQAQPNVDGSGKAKADKAWKNVGTTDDTPEPIDGVKTYREAVQKWGEATVKFWSYWNKCRLRYREEGLRFWTQFPDDPRRFQWLLATVWTPPNYWKDWEQATRAPDFAPIDEEAQKAWEETYIVLRAEFMTSPHVADGDRGLLRITELMRNVWSIKGPDTWAEKRNLNQLANQLLDLAPNSTVPQSLLIGGAGTVLNAIGDDPKAEAAFIAAMKLSPRAELQLFANGREQVAKLRAKPMDLQITTMMGEKIDLAKLRGKVVLVDIWSNWCESCITAMPRVQAVYDKYRDRGFEVVGVWLTADEAKEKPQALKFLRDKGATWPNGVLTGQARKDFDERYSIIGVPVTWLLDQNGLLVTNDISGPRLEQEVKRLLGL